LFIVEQRKGEKNIAQNRVRVFKHSKKGNLAHIPLKKTLKTVHSSEQKGKHWIISTAKAHHTKLALMAMASPPGFMVTWAGQRTPVITTVEYGIKIEQYRVSHPILAG